MLLIIRVESLRKIPSHWRLAGTFFKKMAASGFILLQNRQQQQVFGNIIGGCSDMVWILVGEKFCLVQFGW